MKKRFILLVGVFLLTVMMGCGTKEKASVETTPEPTRKEEIKQEKLLELPQSIQDIYYGDGEFYDVSQKKTYNKKNYVWYKDDEKRKLIWHQYVVMDIDQDGEKELIICFKNLEAAQVFDAQPDKVYCYSFPYRAILHVFEDGVILGSSGAADNDWYFFKFQKEKVEETVVASEDSNYPDIDYRIKNKKVSEEKFWKFIDKNYSDNQEIPWTDF